MTLKYAWFPGCWVAYRMPYVEKSDRLVMERFGIEIEEMKGATCCPEAQFMEAVDRRAWLTLAARNISIAEGMGRDILTPCPGCYETLKMARGILKEDEEMAGIVGEALKKIGVVYRGTSDTTHLAGVLYDKVGIEAIRKAIVRPLTGLRVAVHYGCHLLRPSKYLDFDDPTSPRKLDELVEATGAVSVNYMRKTMCCGGPAGVVDREIGIKILREKLYWIKKAKVDAIVVACPSCYMHMDGNQPYVEEMFEEKYSIPVLWYTELLNWAMGVDPKDLKFYHRVRIDPLLEKLGLT